MTDTSMINSIQTTVVEWLASALIDDVTDDTKVGLVRKGKLQDDPTIKELNILIKDGGDEWKHIRAPRDYHALSYVGPFEMGGPQGGVFWLRRFTIVFTLFFVGETDRAVAIEKSNIILSRAQHAVWTTPLPSGADSFNERAIDIDVEDWWLREGGGTGNFIRKGELRFEVLTEITS